MLSRKYWLTLTIAHTHTHSIWPIKTRKEEVEEVKTSAKIRRRDRTICTYMITHQPLSIHTPDFENGKDREQRNPRARQFWTPRDQITRDQISFSHPFYPPPFLFCSLWREQKGPTAVLGGGGREGGLVCRLTDQLGERSDCQLMALPCPANWTLVLSMTSHSAYLSPYTCDPH